MIDVSDPALSAADDPRVLAVLKEYQDALDAGRDPDPAGLAARHPDLAPVLAGCLSALRAVRAAAPTPNPDATPAPPGFPERLGDFRIVREVGRGGMGVVYEAVQEPLGRPVALKVLPPAVAQDPAYLDRFRREARTAARLHHTNIVPVFGVGEQDGVHFLAMQLIDGRSLDVVWQGVRGAATPTPGDDAPTVASLGGLFRADRAGYFRAVAGLIAQAADALAYAHAQGVVHRDVKPGNLILDVRGTVWVSDFGLAKADGSDGLTLPGFVVGTPRYMAPERLDGTDTPAGDVYALGATLYELLTLRPVFPDADRARLPDRIRRADPVRPRAVDPGVPRDLETVALKCLAKDPRRRYAAAELAEDLRRFLAGRPVRARRVGPAERLARWAGRNPVVAGLTAAVFLSLMAGLAASLWFGWQADKNRREAEHNAAVAERRQADAQQAVEDSFVALSDHQFFDLPGTHPLRRDLLQTALRYYRKFLDERQGDPALRGQAAGAMLRLAAIHRSLGERDRAVEYYTRARDELLPVATADPTWEHRSDLAAAWAGLAGEHTEAGRDEPAREAFVAARGLLDPLVRERPDVLEPALLLARLDYAEGNVAATRSRHPEALAHWASIPPLLEPWLDRRPDDPKLLLTLAEVESRTAHIEITNRKPADDRLERAWKLADRALAVRPDGWRMVRLLADVENSRGVVFLRGRKPREARDEFAKAEARLARLNAAHPNHVEIVYTRHAVLGRLAAAHHLLADLPAAVRTSEQAVALADGLLALQPDALNTRMQLGMECQSLAGYYQQARRPDDALRALDRSIELLDPLARRAEPRLFDLTLLAAVHDQRGTLLRKQNRLAEAADAYAAAVAAAEKGLIVKPKSARLQSDLTRYLCDEGSAAREAGRTDQARRALTAAWPRLAGNATYLAEVSAEFARLGPADGETAVAVLRDAVAAGYADLKAVQEEKAFDQFRDRADFQAVVAELEKKVMAKGK